MKKIAMILVVLIATAMTLQPINAGENNGVVKTVSSYDLDYYIPCIDDNVTGQLTVTVKESKNNYQVMFKGTCVDSNGNEYTVSQVSNVKSSSTHYKYVVTLAFTDMYGNDTFTLHITQQINVNANGEVKVDLYNYFWECGDSN